MPRRGPAVHRWIDSQLQNTSVTAVLIGAQTSARPYVRYEIPQSYGKGNGMLGVYVHNLENQEGRTDNQGQNPFETFHITKDGRKVLLSTPASSDYERAGRVSVSAPLRLVAFRF